MFILNIENLNAYVNKISFNNNLFSIIIIKRKEKLEEKKILANLYIDSLHLVTI